MPLADYMKEVCRRLAELDQRDNLSDTDLALVREAYRAQIVSSACADQLVKDRAERSKR